MKRSKNNLRVLQVLNDAELLLSPTEITLLVFGEVTLNHRIMTSQVLRRMKEAGYVAEPEKHLVEITLRGVDFLNPVN